MECNAKYRRVLLSTIALTLFMECRAGDDDNWAAGIEASLFGGAVAEYKVLDGHRVSASYAERDGWLGVERRYSFRYHYVFGGGNHKAEMAIGQSFVREWDRLFDGTLVREKNGPYLMFIGGYRFESSDGTWVIRTGGMFSAEPRGFATVLPWPYVSVGVAF